MIQNKYHIFLSVSITVIPFLNNGCFFLVRECPSLYLLIVSILICLFCGALVFYLLHVNLLLAELLNLLGEKCFEFIKTYVLKVRVHVNYVQPIF